MGTGELNADELASHPGGSRNTPSRFMPAKETEISSGLMGHLARIQTLPTFSNQRRNML